MPYTLFWFLEMFPGLIHLRMLIIYITLVLTYVHACFPTAESADEASQLTPLDASECDAPLLVGTHANDMYYVNWRIDVIFPV